MKSVENIGEIFWDGSMVNLKKSSIQELDTISEKILVDEKKVKNEIYNIIKEF